MKFSLATAALLICSTAMAQQPQQLDTEIDIRIHGETHQAPQAAPQQIPQAAPQVAVPLAPVVWIPRTPVRSALRCLFYRPVYVSAAPQVYVPLRSCCN